MGPKHLYRGLQSGIWIRKLPWVPSSSSLSPGICQGEADVAIVHQAWQASAAPGLPELSIHAIEPETVQGAASTGAHRVLAGRSSVSLGVRAFSSRSSLENRVFPF